MTEDRPVGVSSRVRPGPHGGQAWSAGNGTRVQLPLIVDYVVTGESGGTEMEIEATVDLVDGRPAITHMSLGGVLPGHDLTSGPG